MIHALCTTNNQYNRTYGFFLSMTIDVPLTFVCTLGFTPIVWCPIWSNFFLFFCTLFLSFPLSFSDAHPLFSLGVCVCVLFIDILSPNVSVDGSRRTFHCHRKKFNTTKHHTNTWIHTAHTKNWAHDDEKLQKQRKKTSIRLFQVDVKL